ncbi:MAG: PAS domain S-box protein [Methylobacteriaceae bacterium]|nr:PAS domain S-box protein [Methylobacteriaceae bacterium]
MLIDAVVDYAIYTISLDGEVLSWNSGARRLKGYEAEEIIGQPFSRFFLPEDQQRAVPQHTLAIAAKTGRHEAEGWRVRKDGSRFWALAVLDAIRDDNGEVIGFVKVTRDITDRVEAQKKVREAQERLAASQKMEALGQLSGGIAHDFNNLMMIVLGNLETAQQYVRNNPAAGTANLQRALNNATRGAQRAAALTSRLLAFSRRQPLNPKPLDVNKFLLSAVDFLERSLGERIQIETVGAAGLWQVEVDANQLESTLVNLAINARDAMREGGKLTIETANTYLDPDYCRTVPELAPGQYVLISLTDTGIGMTPDILDRAFEPFFTTKEFGQGTGLGLSQVYGFVKQSSGHVKLYSEPGQGTTVKIYLPRFVGRAGEDEEQGKEPVGEGEQGETVLVVEDDADLRTYLVEVLRRLRYRVLSAAEAIGALAFLERPETRIDLLLTDVVMPGLNGRELGRRALELRPGLKVLYMTGYSRNAVVHQGRLDEGVELLQKPISQPELAGRIRDMLDRAG